MIEIINEQGLSLELDENFTLAIERNNSLFNRNDEFFQDITYPGKTGLTENNKMFIRSGHLIEASVYNYEFHVDVMVDGHSFFSGSFAYKIVNQEISFILKVSYAAIIELCENTMLTDIRYPLGRIAVTIANKQDTLLNPDNWPMAYFPVYHDTYKAEEIDGNGEPIEYWSNPFDVEKGEKYDWKNPDPRPWRDMAHYKLTYIIKSAIQSLGLTATGSFFENARIKDLYIYNDRFTGFSSTYAADAVPAISISELLKAIKERFKLDIAFDLANKKVIFEDPNTFMNSDRSIDISDYVSEIVEIESPERKNYSIYAKNNDEFNSPYYLSVKDYGVPNLPEEKLEIAISTLPVKLLSSNTSPNIPTYTFPFTSQPFLTGSSISKFRPRPDNLGTDNIGSRGTRESSSIPQPIQLRLLRFSGFTFFLFKRFPDVGNLPFELADGEWYAFLNDSKKIKLKAYVPVYVLAEIDPHLKLGFISHEGLFVAGIIKKIEYALSNRERELIEVDIEVHVRTERRSKVELVELPAKKEEEPGTRPPRS